MPACGERPQCVVDVCRGDRESGGKLIEIGGVAGVAECLLYRLTQVFGIHARSMEAADRSFHVLAGQLGASYVLEMVRTMTPLRTKTIPEV
jgi:hypothetical protein